VLAFCGLDPVRTRFGITLDDLELYDRWVAELGTTWGLDGPHRADWLSVDVPDGTWAATLDRVLVGAAMPAPLPARRRRRRGCRSTTWTPAGSRRRTASPTSSHASVAHAPTPGSATDRRLVRAARPDDRRAVPHEVQDAWQLAEVSKAIDDLRDRSMVTVARRTSTSRSRTCARWSHPRVAAPTGRLNLRSGGR
jgi:hypothetical protein